MSRAPKNSIGRGIRWLTKTVFISGHSSSLNKNICCAMLYRMGDGVLPCASPLSKSKLLERDPSSKTMQADLPVHRVLSKLMKFGPKPKNSKTLRL
jgi:hypothetical protein